MRKTMNIAAYAGAAMLLALSLYHFSYSAYHASEYGFVDFPIFLQEAEHFLESGELYSHVDNMEAYAAGTPVYKFPPLYAMVLLPLVTGGIPDSIYFWHWIVQLVLYLAAVAVILLIPSRPRSGWLVFFGLVLALNFEPFFEALFRLQIETPLLLLFALSLLFHFKGKDALAGAALAICIMLKIYPALLLVYFVVRRRWLAVGWCFATMVLIQVASLIIIGPEQNRLFFFKILPAMMGENAKITLENLAIAANLQTLLDIAPEAARRSAQVICLALLSVSLFGLYRGGGRGHQEEGKALQFALFIPLLLLFLPNSWGHYQVLLLLPFLVVLRASIGARHTRRAAAAVVFIAYLPTLFHMPCADISQPFPCAQTPLFLGLIEFSRPFHDGMVALRIFSNLLIWGVCLFLLLERPLSRTRH